VLNKQWQLEHWQIGRDAGVFNAGKAVHELFCNSVKNWLKSIFMLL
jgi:hypothetical protein